ncbi:MAG: sel1 repeat family protein [Pseudodesulfovibrio sp.]
MLYAAIKRCFAIILITTLAAGCIAGQVSQRRGDKAYLLSDYETAAAEYTEAAASGNSDAMYHLGVMYAEGQGMAKDLTQGASLMRDAAELGQTDAQLMYGLFNIYGDGVPMNPTEGARWLFLAAEENNDIAMYYLGILHAMGLGVQKDIPTALMWMTKAKENGFPVKDAMLTKHGLAALDTN